MAGRIPQAFIDDLLTRVDIVDVVDARVPLKKSGQNFNACCPFHHEKTPSFVVSPSKQIYHCFGCGAGGSVIGFLMDYEHLEFPEAIEELASHAGLSVPREQDPRAVSTAKSEVAHAEILRVMEAANQFYRQQLRDHGSAQRAVEYLKGRGLSGEVAAKYQIGYAPPGWDNLSVHCARAQVTGRDLEAAGLVVKKDNGGYYDRFRERIMFPIHDRRGRVIAFGGRVLGNDEPKYLNSPETALFHKSQALYGLNQARQAMRDTQRVIVVEGYLDVVSLAQFEVQNTVATLGTATTEQHVKQLFRYVPEIVFCFDGDSAGYSAAWRALQNALSHLNPGRQIRFMFLPSGEDPDSFVRQHGAPAFIAQQDKAMPLSNFLFDRLMANLNLSVEEGRTSLLNRAIPLIQQIPDSTFQLLLRKKLSEIARIDAQELSTLITPTASSPQSPAVTKKPKANQTSESGAATPLRKTLRMLLERPQLAQQVDIHLIEGLELVGVPLLINLVEMIHARPQISCGAILEHWRDSRDGAHLAKLAKLPINIPDEGIEAEFADSVNWLINRKKAQRIEELLSKDRVSRLSKAETTELNELMRSTRR